MMKEMKIILELMEKSKENIREAKYLLNGKFYAGSATRSYYAMFHAAQAILYTTDIGPKISTHKGVIMNFHLHFVKTKILSKEMSKIISRGQKVRDTGDYDSSLSVSRTQAEKTFEDAKLFVKEIEKYIEQKIEKAKKVL